MNHRRISQIIIGGVALHSLVLGTLMLLIPVEFLNWLGWPYRGPVFFPSQSGIYLLILGGAYLAGVRYRPFAWFLVATKAAAVIFLLSHALVETGPRPFLLQVALLDGLMGLAVVLVLVTGRGEN